MHTRFLFVLVVLLQTKKGHSCTKLPPLYLCGGEAEGGVWACPRPRRCRCRQRPPPIETRAGGARAPPTPAAPGRPPAGALFREARGAYFKPARAGRPSPAARAIPQPGRILIPCRDQLSGAHRNRGAKKELKI